MFARRQQLQIEWKLYTQCYEKIWAFYDALKTNKSQKLIFPTEY